MVTYACKRAADRFMLHASYAFEGQPVQSAIKLDARSYTLGLQLEKGGPTVWERSARHLKRYC